MIDRRNFLWAAGVAAGASALAERPAPAGETAREKLPTRFALNMSTIRGQQLSFTEQIEVAAAAGYDGIEPWIRDVRQEVESGTRPAELKARIAEAGLTVDSAIGFASWIVDDDEARAAGLKEARRDMELVAAIGGRRIAAPPVGAHRSAGPPLPVIAERYRALLQVGEEAGVVPMLELWGFSPTLSTLAELAYVATGSGHGDACVLPDFYHIYKGGNDFLSLGTIEASRMPVFHINDYPADPPLEKIGDKDRVFPGDGVCPLVDIIALLLEHGFRGTFSLELFNPEYWQRDAAEVAAEGLRKSRAVVAAAAKAADGKIISTSS